MNSIIWLFTGAVLGWLAPIVMRRRRSEQLLNIIVGMVGAFVAGHLLPRVFQVTTVDQGIFSLPALMISLGGAVFLLAVVNFFRREKNVKSETIERKWVQVRDKIQTRWGKLSEEDCAKIDGNHELLNATLQARYGFTKKQAEDQIQGYLKAVLFDSKRSIAYDQLQIVGQMADAAHKSEKEVQRR